MAEPAKPGAVCPLHQKDVSKVCHKCPWWTLLRGKHPQTGGDMDEWICAVSALPMLLIENARHVRGTSAAVESFRNEMAQGQQASAAILRAVLASPADGPKLLEG